MRESEEQPSPTNMKRTRGVEGGSGGRGGTRFMVGAGGQRPTMWVFFKGEDHRPGAFRLDQVVGDVPASVEPAAPGSDRPFDVPIGLRRAHFRWLRAPLGAFLRRAGTGSTDTWRTRCVRTRPTVLSLTARNSGNSHRTATAILAFPRTGRSRRASWTASASVSPTTPSAAGAEAIGIGTGFKATLPSKPVPVEERGSRDADHFGGLSRRGALAPRQMPSIQNAVPESSDLAAFRCLGRRRDRLFASRVSLLFAITNGLGDPSCFADRCPTGWRVQSNMCLNSDITHCFFLRAGLRVPRCAFASRRSRAWARVISLGSTSFGRVAFNFFHLT